MCPIEHVTGYGRLGPKFRVHLVLNVVAISCSSSSLGTIRIDPAVMGRPLVLPEGPSTQCFRTLNLKNHDFMVSGTRVLKY